jgi:hypothetical protein
MVLEEIEFLIRQRQFDLWTFIVRNYNIDERLQNKVYKWIINGIFHEKVIAVKQEPL